MRNRLAVFVPLIAGTGVFATGLSLSAGQRVWFYASWALVAKSAAVAGGAIAALAFARGDYLRRAWLFVCIGYLPLVLKDVTPGGGPWLPVAADVWGTVRALLAALGNGLSVIGLWWLARTTRVAGLEPPGSPTARRALVVLGTALAVAIVWPGMRGDLHDANARDVSSLVNVFGDMGDVVSFALVAPVLLTAIAMRGGRLVWPWALLTLGNIAWLAFDGPPAFAALAHSGMTPLLRAVGEGARTSACLYYAAASLAQRWAVAGHE